MAFKLPKHKPPPKPTLCAFRDRRFYAPPARRLALDSEGKRCAPTRRSVAKDGTISYFPNPPVRATFVGDRSKYKPHQGAAECERRRARA